MREAKAVILLSGGLDSTTCLAIAKASGHECHTISFDYGQRAVAEVNATIKITEQYSVASHRVVHLDFQSLGRTALTDPSAEMPQHNPAEGEIPITYVPSRNIIFLSMASSYAELIGAHYIYIGANVVDYSNYPDCRPEFIAAFEEMLRQGTKIGLTGTPIKIEAPLMYLRKVDIIRRGIALGVDYSVTVSCYQADSVGRACGVCSSCLQRKEGFERAGLVDPTRYFEG